VEPLFLHSSLIIVIFLFREALPVRVRVCEVQKKRASAFMRSKYKCKRKFIVFIIFYLYTELFKEIYHNFIDICDSMI